MLDANLLAQLKTYLANVLAPIELVASIDERPQSADLRVILTEIANWADLVTARFDGTAERRPSFRIERVGTDVAVEFAGLPSATSSPPSCWRCCRSAATRSRRTRTSSRRCVTSRVTSEFVTYMSLSCQNCPRSCRRSTP